MEYDLWRLLKEAAKLKTVFNRELINNRGLPSVHLLAFISSMIAFFFFFSPVPTCVGNPGEPAAERTKEERVEKAVTEANGPEEEMESEEAKGEEEEEEGKGSDETEKKAEGVVKKTEARTGDENGPAAAKEEEEEVVEKGERGVEESPKSQTAKDKEPSKKTPISSFFGEGGLA